MMSTNIVVVIDLRVVRSVFDIVNALIDPPPPDHNWCLFLVLCHKCCGGLISITFDGKTHFNES